MYSMRDLIHKGKKVFLSRTNMLPFPDYICLETTNSCNLRCVQCLYQGGTTEHYKEKVGFIDTGLAKKVLDQLKRFDTGVMLNGDGETLLHPNFHEIAEYAILSGLTNVYFNTNGTLMTPEFTDKFLKYFKGSVSISLDGFKESHERMRRGSSYDMVTKNIFYLKKQVDKLHLPIKISVAYCNYDQPEGEREDFIKYWIDKVDMLTVGEVYDKDYKIISKKMNVSKNARRVKCLVPWRTFIVRWNGLVVPCSNCFSLAGSNDIILGNAKDQALLDVWNGGNMDKFRQRMKKMDIKGTVCEKCERWNMFLSFPVEKNDGMTITKTGVFSFYQKIK
jgi:radical SAM protein with 4Fe4S-binding SPASM domain